jgi:hypothetical protein
MRDIVDGTSRPRHDDGVFSVVGRVAPGLGLLFAALMVAAYTLEAGSPGANAIEWTTYYEDPTNRRKEEIAFVLVGLACVCFLVFLGSLRGALARAEGEPAPITTASIGSGVAFITLAVAAHAVGTSMAWAEEFNRKEFTLDPDTAQLVSTMSYALFAMSLFAAAAMAFATGAIGLSRHAMPPWLAWLGVLAGIAALFGIFGLPAVLVLIWIGALSLSLAWPSGTPPGVQKSG